jgi:YYY domain-containing protein
VAGISALMLAVVLGNLDTPRVFVNGLADTGFYESPAELANYLIQQYTEANGSAPPESELSAIQEQAETESGSFLASLRRGMERLLQGTPLTIGTNRWYWAPTRVLAETPGVEGNAINEMPFFTFLYGDLHAHMINMPVLLIIMAFLLNELLLAGNDPRSRLAKALALAFGALAVGLIRATNTWDYPSFMLFSVLGMIYVWWLRWRRINRWTLLNFAVYVGGFVLLSIVLTLPYITWYAATYNTIGLWDGGKTPLWAYFDIHGLFLFLVLSLLVWDTARWLRSVYVRSLQGTWMVLVIVSIAVAAILAGVVILSIAGYQVSLVVIPMILWIAALFFRKGQTRAMQFVLVLVGLALALTLGVEFFVVGGDIGRQNTVFKFYIQAWLLFSVAGGSALGWLIYSSSRWSGFWRNAWFGGASVLIVMAAMYPVMASRAKAIDRMAADVPFTLDGMEYMKYAQLFEGDPLVLQNNPSAAPFALEGDYHLIRWLQENVQGTPVIIEGRADREYRWEGRISIYTGLPSVIGWNWHQRQQRTFDPMPRLVQQRVANVNAFYTTPDISVAWEMLRHYDVSYIIIGNLERAYYGPEGLAKFDQMEQLGLLEIVYQQDQSQVYRVNKGAVLREVG